MIPGRGPQTFQNTMFRAPAVFITNPWDPKLLNKLSKTLQHDLAELSHTSRVCQTKPAKPMNITENPARPYQTPKQLNQRINEAFRT